MGKKISDEKLLEMLLVHGSVKDTAAAVGISRNAIYKRLRDDVFRTEYDRLQGVLLSTAAAKMADTLTDAVEVLQSIINDEFANQNTRINAADSLLRHCVRYVEVSDILRRVEALENGNA